MTTRLTLRTQLRAFGKLGDTDAAPGAGNTTRPLTPPSGQAEKGASVMLPNTLTARDHAVALLYANRLEGERLLEQVEQFRTARNEVVRLARKHAGMTNIDIGHELGISDSFVSRLGRGDA